MPDNTKLLAALIATLPGTQDEKSKIEASEDPATELTQLLDKYSKQKIDAAVDLAFKQKDSPRVKELINEGYRNGQGNALAKRDEWFKKHFGDLDLKYTDDDGNHVSFEKVYEQASQALRDKGSNKGDTELRKEIISLKKALTDKEVEFKVEKEGIIKNFQEQEKKRFAFDYLKSHLPKADTLSLNISDIETLMRNHFETNFKVEVDDTNSVKVLMKNGNPVTNKEGNAELLPSDIVAEFANRFVKQSTGDPPANDPVSGDPVIVNRNNGRPGVDPRLTKAEQAIEEAKARQKVKR